MRHGRRHNVYHIHGIQQCFIAAKRLDIKFLRSKRSRLRVNVEQADKLVVLLQIEEAFQVDFAEVACADDADF